MSSSAPVRVAAVDCGTNSLRLLVADVDLASGTLVDLARTMEVVRLGEGVDSTGEISPAALARTLAATERVRDAVREHGVAPGRVRFVATSASRDARNAQLLVDGVRDLLGIEPEVVTGEEEASLSFLGATGELAREHPAPFLVCDLGGGSTELVLGAGAVEAARSVDVGCVRLHERHALADPPSPGQVAAVVADVRAALDLAAAPHGPVPLPAARTLVGVAGTVTTVTAHALGLPAYLPERIHGSVVPVADVLAACDDLVAMPRAQRAALPFMHPGRVDVIGAGALVWREVVSRVAAESGVVDVVSSEHDILDGIALALARSGGTA